MEENKPHMSSVMRSSMEASRCGKMLLQNNTNKFSQTKTKFCSNRIHSKGHSERSQDFSSKRCAFINENHLKSQNNEYSPKVKEDKLKCKRLCNLCEYINDEDDIKEQKKLDKFILFENYRQDEFNTTLNLIAGMHDLPAGVLKKLYRYKQYAKEIEAEYKSSIADPSRITALHEKQIAIKKNNR